LAPRDAQLTVEQWCKLWIVGYAVHRDSSVARACKCIRRIVAEFGDMPLSALRPSQIKGWGRGCNLLRTLCGRTGKRSGVYAGESG
jgi:hypothetical protein